ncbi:LutB/LldF family L-lactate oxidation iron-sulfur protein [Tistrella bauzanensis]|uniref:LutB/LldF family L-lactate oxidation iron-sulfur protein n=1 Tax=Tistrella arctica TaxID=3133430 RepID=A0ABU9YGU5_9PROT
MQATSHQFKDNVKRAMGDAELQASLSKIKNGFVPKRAAAAAALPEFETLRDEARDIKNHVLGHLDIYLERFTAEVEARGGHVHWAPTAADARRIIIDLARESGARTITKSKSMVTEEIALNDALEQVGIEPIETDLGEYIIQLAKEPPSHIIAPAIHKTKEQVAELFLRHHGRYGKTQRLTEPTDMVREAREVLRQKYLDADMGITGANFLVAETGSIILVTNEGNADLTLALPKRHVVVAGIEKLVPTLEDASTMLRVLARSATGQEFSSYTTLVTGPKRDGDLDGPDDFHIVLLDNGRSGMIGTEFQDMLRCIRCGACMNHCPVYNAVGGHAYGWVYPGPMGAVLTPALIGVDEAGHLPNASTFCGRCEQVCPVRIPLPRMMRAWRTREFERGLNPTGQRWGLGLWAWFARRPRAYRLLSRTGAAVLGRLGRGNGRFRRLPLAGGWTGVRDLPAPEGRSFVAAWKADGRPTAMPISPTQGTTGSTKS